MNRYILTAIIAVLLLVVLVTLFLVVPVSTNQIVSDKADSIKINNKQAIQSNNIAYNGCNSAVDYNCFKYMEIEQERGEGLNYKVEQTRLEPCPKPKPVCPLCYKGIEQERGEGYSENLVQIRVSC